MIASEPKVHALLKACTFATAHFDVGDYVVAQRIGSPVHFLDTDSLARSKALPRRIEATLKGVVDHYSVLKPAVLERKTDQHTVRHSMPGDDSLFGLREPQIPGMFIPHFCER